MKWFIKVLKQYADFSGRARRKEFWMFTLFCCIIVSITAGITGYGIAKGGSILVVGTILNFAVSLAFLVPSLAVMVRRLHDIGKSGWWYFINFIPLIGGILLLIWFCTNSQKGENKWGANPKEEIS